MVMKKLLIFLRKYLYLPLAYVLHRPPVSYDDFDEYEKGLTEAAKKLLNNECVYAVINGRLCKITRSNGKIEVAEI